MSKEGKCGRIRRRDKMQKNKVLAKLQNPLNFLVQQPIFFLLKGIKTGEKINLKAELQC